MEERARAEGDTVHREAVHFTGLLRGAELAGEGTIAVSPPNVEIDTRRRLVVLRLASLDGIERRGDALILHLAWGDVIELRGPASLDPLADAIAEHALALPELTASLRSYGSPRAGAGAEQEAFFSPLRQALARMAQAGRASRAVSVFASDRLSSELSTEIARMAARRYPDHPPERRALETELYECAATVERRLDALREAQEALEESAASQQFAAWRRWSEALLAVFSAHDACWPLVRASLHAAPDVAEEPKRSWWKGRGTKRDDDEEAG